MPTIATQLQSAHTSQADQAQQAAPPPPPPPPSSAQNSTSNFVPAPAPPPSGDAPTGGAREATPKPLTNKEIDALTQERLSDNPEYAALQQKLEEWKGLETDFALIDSYTGLFVSDGKVTLENLKAIANDPLWPNADAKAAAQRLLANMSVWNEMAKGDNCVGTQDVTDFINKMKSDLAEMKATTKAEIKAEIAEAKAPAGAAQSAGADGSAAGGAQSAGASGAAANGPLFTASTPSSKSGMEGAVENVNNALKGIGDSMNSIMTEMTDPKTTPERRQELQAQYNELQQLQSMLTAMYKQMQEAISNLLKMYSDVAQNSVRNMK